MNFRSIFGVLAATVLFLAPGAGVQAEQYQQAQERPEQRAQEPPPAEVIAGRLHTWTRILSMQAGYYLACRERELIEGRPDVARHAAFMAGMVGEFLQLDAEDYRGWNREGYNGRLMARTEDGPRLAEVDFTEASCRRVADELLPFLNRTRRAILLDPVP